MSALLSACAARPPATVSIAAPAPPAPVPGPAAPAESPAPSALAALAAAAAPVPAPEPDALAPPPAGSERAWLGVELAAAAPEEQGVRVGRVVPRSPAAKAGLLAGDLLQRIDADPVAEPADVVRLVSGHHGGDHVGVALRRDGAERLLKVTLGAAPDQDEIYRMGFVDQPAPPLELLQTATGTFTPSLQAQRGQVLVVEFWAPWCVACRALIPHMNQWHEQYAARGLRVLGVTTDPVPRAASAARQLGIEYPVASDADGKTTVAYRARSIPTVFVIDRSGTVRDVMVGFDNDRLPKLNALVERLVAER